MKAGEVAALRFVDTNVLIYAASRATADPERRNRARELLSEPDLAVSVQVIQEFYHQATRPTRPGCLSHDQAPQFLEPILNLPIQGMTVEVFQTAVTISHRFRLSYWDGAILAAARVAGCEAIYSEDFSAEHDYDGLRVINPFKEASAA